MIEWLAGRARCLLSEHVRSPEKARYRGEDRDQMTSVCQYCGVPMRRIAKRNWVVDKRR